MKNIEVIDRLRILLIKLIIYIIQKNNKIILKLYLILKQLLFLILICFSIDVFL